MSPDAIQVVIAFLVIFALRDIRDGILAWRLIGRALDVQPQPPPGPAPPIKPVPPSPVPPVPVPPVPVARTPRYTNISATSFAGASDSKFSRTGAYSGKPIDSNRPAVALPFRFTGTRPIVRVFYKGKSVDATIEDVGPWNGSTARTSDPYWTTNTRPQAETGTDLLGRKTNHAGIDLTPGAWAALGFTGNLEQITAVVSWDFVDYLGATPAPPTPAPAPVVTGLLKNVWPTQADAESFFGNPASAGWEAANLVSVTCPWELTVEGTKSRTIRIHRKCAVSLTRILEFIWEQCGRSQAQINAFGYNVFDGSYNFRQIRGGSGLSMHSYGIAMDWNAAANPQHAPLSQTKFKPESLIVFAFETEGWIWGGRWGAASIDSMHFQAARVR